ncbi:histidine phosphatase family protein [Paenibacillus donghaensis]|uniref:histidine phosphatase family protein n=1 Tax=Paenibacillus donghaensis TaxID=414771 RepID=UPI0018834339|nr:histidine phosphatase family protein [Paenibacillus donghaensis]MBE9914918.1 histidine phosphatase family protein [Paenibacillus donghaensis]
MQTVIYMVRHGESPKAEGNERTRALTDKGMQDAKIITELLKDEGIDTFISSPYRRAVLTIEEAARSAGKEVLVIENLKEIVFAGEDKILQDHEVYPLVKKMFAEPGFSLPGGESMTIGRERTVAVLKKILKDYKGQKVAIGTHGAVMTLMMGHFDSQYDVKFLFTTSKPDIYRMEFDEDRLIDVTRLWG